MAAMRNMLGNFRRLNVIFRRRECWITQQCARSCSTLAGSQNTDKDPGKLFINSEVQEILHKITSFDINKVFRERPVADLKAPKYQLLTDQQLQEIQDEAERRAYEELQMPPVLKEREIVTKVLADNPEIAGYDEAKLVFTDVTYGVPDKKRQVVVREPSGLLRDAYPDERDRMLHLYTPRPGKTHNMPHMFEESQLEMVLAEGRHEYVLDRACVQFEPDNPIYIRVTHRTYEHLNSEGGYDSLRSTRHFGPMAFYLSYYNKIDGLLIDMLHRDMLSDAGDLVKLHHIIHPTSQSAEQANQHKLMQPLDLIKNYVKTDAKQAGKNRIIITNSNRAITTSTSIRTLSS